MISHPLELAPGVKVRYQPGDSDTWRQGTLVRPSTTGEEWLVNGRFGRFWISVNRLRPADGTLTQR